MTRGTVVGSAADAADAAAAAMMKSKKKPSKEKSEDMDDAKFNHSIALGNEGRDIDG